MMTFPFMSSVGLETKAWAEALNIPCVYSREIGSTNDQAKSWSYPPSHHHGKNSALTLFVTDFQTHGRGRGENSWLNADPGSTLLSSWSCAVDPAPQPLCSPRMGLALARSAQATWTELPWSLKAPNDLLLNGKKIAGLLIESISDGISHRLIVGLGFNLCSHPTIPEVTSVSVHLTGSKSTWNNEWCRPLQIFLNHFLSEIKNVIKRCGDTELHQADCQDIMFFLNSNPKISDPVVEVFPDGSLRSKNSVIHWNEL